LLENPSKKEKLQEESLCHSEEEARGLSNENNPERLERTLRVSKAETLDPFQDYNKANDNRMERVCRKETKKADNASQNHYKSMETFHRE
jgi:hypothetical protein